MHAVARWVSIVGHPFATTLVMVSAVALRVGSSHEALRSSGLVALIVLLPIAALMARQVRRGAWTNVDASNRAERPALFVVMTASLAALLVVAFVFRSASF